ncbi:MAG: hypothetical protein ACE5F8_06545, partial [Woeseiaceae bacterium]
MSEPLASAVILAHGSGGLGALRSLARRGVAVTVIAFDPSDVIMYSRHADRKLIVTGDTDEAKEQRLLQILRELPSQGAALMATSDRLVSLRSDHRDELLQRYRYVLPPQNILDALNDKQQETQLIASLGFDLPKTVNQLPAEPGALELELRFPIIFKPQSFAAESRFPKKNEVVADHEELIGFYECNEHALPVLLAQEVITGPDTYSWVVSCTFDREHHLLDCGVKQKIRCLPAHYGGSTYAVCRNNEAIVELARSIGKKLEYVGHAGIEFRWDQRDRRYKFIELNPRVPANVGFDEACGLSTTWNSYRIALGENAEHSGASQKDGTYFIDLTGDLASLRADRVSPVGIIAS